MQLRPSIDLPTEKVDKVNNSNRPVVIQTWQKNGTCPKGTVAIRRIRKEDLLRAASLEHFGRKPYTAKRKEAANKSKFINSNNTKLSNNDLEMPNHSVSILLGSFCFPISLIHIALTKIYDNILFIHFS